MNKSVYLTVVAVIAAMFAASAVHAEMTAPPQGQGMMQQGGMQKDGMQQGMMPPAEEDPQSIANHKAEEELELKNRKSEMLLHISNRMDEMKKEQACIEAATTREALHSCGGMHGGGMHHCNGGEQCGMMGGMHKGGMMQGGEGGMMGAPGGMHDPEMQQAK